MQKKNRHKSLVKNGMPFSGILILSLVFQMVPGLTLKYQHSIDLQKSQVKREFTLNVKEGKGH